jgi:hypothetical protein
VAEPPEAEAVEAAERQDGGGQDPCPYAAMCRRGQIAGDAAMATVIQVRP